MLWLSYHAHCSKILVSVFSERIGSLFANLLLNNMHYLTMVFKSFSGRFSSSAWALEHDDRSAIVLK